MFKLKKLFAILLILLFGVLKSQDIQTGIATSDDELIDTNYIVTFPERITTRLYFSRKFTNLSLEDYESGNTVDYEPNTTLNFGIGATVQGFTLNLAYGFNFLNPDEGKGETKYLDLQSHIYTRKVVIDFLGQFYNGQYLSNTNFYDENYPEPHYLRPDLKIRIFGVSALFVNNYEKFSYAAAYVQNEYQKKSSGSLLYGAKGFYQLSYGDSSFIPSIVDTSLFSDIEGIDYLESIKVGPAIGYTYTFVIKQHFFLNLSLDFAVLLSNVYYEREGFESESQFQVNPSVAPRIAFGYNSVNSYLGVMFVTESTQNRSVTKNEGIVYGIGNVRLNYVKRFVMGKKTKNFIDKLPLP